MVGEAVKLWKGHYVMKKYDRERGWVGDRVSMWFTLLRYTSLQLEIQLKIKSRLYKILQLYLQILIAILLNWMLCGILTTTGVLTDDPTDRSYKTRTDARSGVIAGSPWFNFPYPGKTYFIKKLMNL